MDAKTINDQGAAQVLELRSKLELMQAALQQATLSAEAEVAKSRRQAEKLKVERQRLRDERDAQDRRVSKRRTRDLFYFSYSFRVLIFVPSSLSSAESIPWNTRTSHTT